MCPETIEWDWLIFICMTLWPCAEIFGQHSNLWPAPSYFILNDSVSVYGLLNMRNLELLYIMSWSYEFRWCKMVSQKLKSRCYSFSAHTGRTRTVVKNKISFLLGYYKPCPFSLVPCTMLWKCMKFFILWNSLSQCIDLGFYYFICYWFLDHSDVIVNFTIFLLSGVIPLIWNAISVIRFNFEDSVYRSGTLVLYIKAVYQINHSTFSWLL